MILKRQDMKSLVKMLDVPRIGCGKGKRVKHDNINLDDVISSMQRSKRKARLTIKNLGCDRLLTLTKRENNPDDFCTPEQWKKDWAYFCKLVKKAGVELRYVSVLEPHKKGNFHLHAAVVGHLPINQLRGIWWAVCGGRGLGNVDIKFKPHLSDAKRRAGVARYVSKYITKQYEIVDDDGGVKLSSHVDFNKKRYWASRSVLPAVKKIVLSAADFIDAVQELADVFGFYLTDFFNKAYKFPGNDAFPHGSGLWFNYDDSGGLFVDDVPF
jgi:hypothetical protein